MRTKIRLLLYEQSDLVTHCLLLLLGNYLQQTTLTDDIIRCIFVGALRVNTHTDTEGFDQHCMCRSADCSESPFFRVYTKDKITLL